MSNECLVTKLKGAVNNPALPKMGYLGFEVRPVEGVDNFQPFIISGGTDDGKPLAYIEGEGNFYADEQRTQLIGKELPSSGMYIHTYLSHDVQHVFLNKYGLDQFEPYKVNAQFLSQVDLEDFKYFKKLKDLNVTVSAYNFFGANTNLDDLDADVAAGLERLTISGDNIAGNIERFSGLTHYSSLDGRLSMSGVTGEISTLSRLPQIFLSLGNHVTYHGQKGENSIPTLLIMDVELGDDVDNYLIDTARLTQGINIGDYEYRYHYIEINGNRTSASDAAVATLKQWGVNYIRVNGVNV